MESTPPLSLPSPRQVETGDPDIEALRVAPDEAAGDIRARLAARVTSVITDVVRRRMRDSRDRQELDDLRHDAMLQLLVKLQRVCASPDEPPIADLAAYAAVVADRVCSAHLRRKWPQRSRLKNRVRYVLTRDPSLRVIDCGRGEWLCGLAAWPEPWTASGVKRLRELRAGSRANAIFAIGRDDPARVALPRLVARVLEFSGGPVELDELVSAAADLLGVTDHPISEPSNPEDSGDWPRSLPDETRPLPDRLGDRAFLSALWGEVRQLPVNQRRALLLNLRDEDGHDVASLLPLIGAASVPDVAACLEMPLADLRALWPGLPLDDNTLAGRLGLTRQQVINLRKSARDRLARRMRGWRT